MNTNFVIEDASCINIDTLGLIKPQLNIGSITLNDGTVIEQSDVHDVNMFNGLKGPELEITAPNGTQVKLNIVIRQGTPNQMCFSGEGFKFIDIWFDEDTGK